MQTLRVDIESAPAEIRTGLAEIIADRADRFSASGEIDIRFEKSHTPAGLSAEWDGRAATIRYGRTIEAFRALGRLLGSSDLRSPGRFAESCQFEMAGAMVDFSRNGVMRVDAIKRLLRHCALMGINMFGPYMEDTYEIPDEPFFGYLRGRYSFQELKAIDDYAAALGIEVIPFIQTLGHLEQILQWPAYQELKDNDGVLLAEEERTYKLIEKMLDAATSPFRSKRIHIGMDEAHGVGTGRYRKIHGEKRPFDVLNAHLKRVRELCLARGLKPMIWSDMYFRLGSKSNHYYDKETVIPPEVIRNIPKDIELVYWDYYHLETEFYEDWIERHRGLGSEPVMAGGVWTWNRLWPAYGVSLHTTDACMKACKKKGLRQVFTTLWGDDGMECDIFAALPGLQYFAEHCYAKNVDENVLRANFKGTTGGDYDAWIKSGNLDALPGVEDADKSENNLAKLLLWEDPVLAVVQPHFDKRPLAPHFQAQAEELLKASRSAPANAPLEFPAQLARVLSLKADLSTDVATAYRGRDRERLRRIAKDELPALRGAVQTLRRMHMESWHRVYKPFGWEVLDQRYGGLLARLETLSDRLTGYVNGWLSDLPEFDEKPILAMKGKLHYFPNMFHSRVKTPSCIK